MVKARAEVLQEQYCTHLEIEGRTLSAMVRTEILPASMRAQAELADAVGATQVAGVECPESEDALRAHVAEVASLRGAIAGVDQALKDAPQPIEKRVRYLRNELVPAMDAVRKASDRLESDMAADCWPVPTYAEMLLINR